MLGVDQKAFSLHSDNHLLSVSKTPPYDIQQQAENFSNRTREQIQRVTDVTGCLTQHIRALVVVTRVVVVLQNQETSSLQDITVGIGCSRFRF